MNKSGAEEMKSRNTHEPTAWNRSCVLFWLLTLVAGCATAEVKTYPPYPDVWEWVAPKKKGMEVESVGATLLTNGDVIVGATYRAHDGSRESSYSLFFDKVGFDTVKSDFQTGRFVIHGGTEVTYASSDILSFNSSGEFSDGTKVTTSSSPIRMCYRGPARWHMSTWDQNNRVLKQRVFFYLLDKPRRFVGGGGQPWTSGNYTEDRGSCPNEGALNLKVMVEPIYPGIVVLPDDTFLMIDREHGVILRVDRELGTRAKIINDRVFSFDYHGDPFIVSELTGKSYGKPDDETEEITQQTYQAALDDFYRYLLTIRKNSGKRK